MREIVSTTSLPTPEKVLVIAPHYDDELFGCGGLLIRLRKEVGSSIDLLFVSDGGEEKESRFREAQIVALHLDAFLLEPLNLPDGKLIDYISEIKDFLKKVLVKGCYDLVLIPSASEITDDHKATFIASFLALNSVRDLDILNVFTNTQFWFYEVNHQLKPNTLVDITSVEKELCTLMELYKSQLKKHPYHNASLGLKKFRTLTLSPETVLAEAYFVSDIENIRKSSLTWFAHQMGGNTNGYSVVTEPLKVSVIVRTFNRPTLLKEALDSIASNRYRNLEVIVVNDGGDKPEIDCDKFDFDVRIVDLDSNKGRAAAANVGLKFATGEYIAFLDDDDLWEPEHLVTITSVAKNQRDAVVYSDAAVVFYEVTQDGWEPTSRKLVYSRDFDKDLIKVDNFIPFNTLLIPREALDKVGLFDESLPFFEDWDFIIRLSFKFRFIHIPRVTCEYRHFKGSDQVFGNDPWRRDDFRKVKREIWKRYSGSVECLLPLIDKFKDEVALLTANLSSMREEIGELRRFNNILYDEKLIWQNRFFELEKRFYPLKGEVEALRLEYERVSADLARFKEAADDRGKHLEQMFAREKELVAEIERLRLELNSRWWRKIFILARKLWRK